MVICGYIVFMENNPTTQKPIFYTNKNGDVKYYVSYRTAWNACIRLNKTAVNGLWLFEADTIGWYLEFHADKDVY